MDMVVDYSYRPETLISVHTNKPIPDTSKLTGNTIKCQAPIFWCEFCHTRLQNAATAVQHISGRSHKSKINIAKEATGEVLNTALKRKLEISSNNTRAEGVVEASANTMSKKQKHDLVTKNNKDLNELDANLKCEICDKVFTNCLLAVQHFKGKKHISKVESAYEQKNNQEPSADLKCEDCSKEFPSATLAVQHFKGKKHAVRMEWISKEKKEEEKPDPILKCDVCDKKFTSNSTAVEHFQGKKHASKVGGPRKEHVSGEVILQPVTGKKDRSKDEPVSKKKKGAEKFNSNLRCDDCDKNFESDALAVEHFKGKKHTSKVGAKMLRKNNRGGRGNSGRGRWNSGFRRGYVPYGDETNNGFQVQSQLGLEKYTDQYFYNNHNPSNTIMQSNGWYGSVPHTAVTNEIMHVKTKTKEV